MVRRIKAVLLRLRNSKQDLPVSSARYLVNGLQDLLLALLPRLSMLNRHSVIGANYKSGCKFSLGAQLYCCQPRAVLAQLPCQRS